MYYLYTCIHITYILYTHYLYTLTNSGRVWRKVPESNALMSVDLHLSATATTTDRSRCRAVPYRLLSKTISGNTKDHYSGTVAPALVVTEACCLPEVTHSSVSRWIFSARSGLRSRPPYHGHHGRVNTADKAAESTVRFHYHVCFCWVRSYLYVTALFRKSFDGFSAFASEKSYSAGEV